MWQGVRLAECVRKYKQTEGKLAALVRASIAHWREVVERSFTHPLFKSLSNKNGFWLTNNFIYSHCFAHVSRLFIFTIEYMVNNGKVSGKINTQ